MKEIAKFLLAIGCINVIAISFILIFVSSQQPSNSTDMPWTAKQKIEPVFYVKQETVSTPVQIEVKPVYSDANPHPTYIAWKKREKEEAEAEAKKAAELYAAWHPVQANPVPPAAAVATIEPEPKIDEGYKWFKEPPKDVAFFPSNNIADSVRSNPAFINIPKDEEQGVWYYTKNTLYYTGVTVGIIAILPVAILAAAASGGSGSSYDNRDALERQGFVRTGATEYVKPNAYGLGTGMNQFGAPVKTVPANGF